MTGHSKEVAIDPKSQPTVFGHPAGLFTLFFAEMWERFSYYGMRALLVLYMIKGFLGYGDSEAYSVYGAYTALVYMTPYIGGMLADRLLGARRAVVIGGLLMAAGHLLMTVEQDTAFFVALALLIVGNGFFKPNISTMVGRLYPRGSAKKDAGFTLFYMGINLGAAMSPILCGYVGETYGWHYGFGLATAGMLIGVAIFVAPRRLTQLLILIGALTAACSMPFLQDSTLQLVVRIVLGSALLIAGLVAVVALERGGVPHWAGRPRDPDALKRKIGGFLRADWTVYLGIVVSIPVFALLVQRNAIAGWVLIATGLVALIYILWEAIFHSTEVERHRLFVVLILMFFSLLFWAFFEQAGSSVNNFTDRNVDRTFESRTVKSSDVGTVVKMRVPPRASGKVGDLPLLSQEQLGHVNGHPDMDSVIERAIRKQGDPKGELEGEERQKLDDKVKKVKELGRFNMTALSELRSYGVADGTPDEHKIIEWKVVKSNVGMGIGGAEIPASEFQAVNPIYILIFGLLFTALWGFLSARGWEPSTPVKFALGLLQLGVGFGCLWYGAQHADARGMVGLHWLLLGYLFHTTGELCLSPVGLSMVTKLSPARIVSTMMGAWFLATAFSNYLAGFIAKFTGVSEGGGDQVIPAPTETVNLYGDVFGTIALTAMGSAVLCLMLSPLLTKWMHVEAYEDE
jgi:POT family proton-dependent oligopeptide transporter